MENPIKENYATEDQLQADCFRWFDATFPALRRTLFSVPNGGLRDKRTAGVLMATGLKKGVSDIIWVLPVTVEFIEMKLPGKTQSDEQIDFEKKVTKLGHAYTVIYSFVEFKTFVINKVKQYYYETNMGDIAR